MFTWFSDKVKQAQQILDSQATGLDFEFNAPATQGEIQRCEELLGFRLPNSYRSFLLFSNGANLFHHRERRFEITIPWMADSGVLIQGTNTIISFNHEQDRIYVEDEKKYIAFAYLGYVGTGDFCSFDVTNCGTTSSEKPEYKVLDCYHDDSFEEWQKENVIADSFEQWLSKMFDEVIQNNHRPEYWIPSLLTGAY